jgi:hypothetical protein
VSATTLDRTEGATAWAAAPGALRRLAPVVVAGGIAGVAAGVWVRVAMRLSALAAPASAQGLLTEAQARIGEITFGGTLFLVLFAGIGSAVLGTAFYLIVRAWLPTRRWIRAVAFGLLELVVFGSVVIDAGNPDLTIVANPAYNVLLFAGAFVLHGMLLVLLQRPARRVVDAVEGGVSWRERLVDGATLLALMAIGLGSVALVLRPGGWIGLVVAVLLCCAIGLAFVEPARTRAITRPALGVVGGAALAVLAIGGALDLLRQVTTIV